MSWPMVKLGDCCEVVSGGTPKREINEYWDGNIYWVTPKDLSQLSSIYIDSTPEKITELGLKKSSATLLPKHSLLFSSRAPIGHLAITTTEMATNQGFKSLIPKSHVDVKYLFFCLKHFKSELENLGNGATFKEVSKKVVENYKIPLPPLPIQKQIAAVLEKADTLCQQCQQMEQELNALAQAVFLDVVGDKNSKFNKWEILQLEALCGKHKGSMRTGPFGSDLKHSEFVESGYPVIGIDNAVDNEFKWKERRFISEEKYKKLKRYTVKPRDVIITIMGTVGRVAVIPENIPVSISTKHLAVLTIDKTKALPEFVADAFKYSTSIALQLKQKNKGAIMDGLNLGLIKSLSVTVPPMSIQESYLDSRKEILDALKINRLQKIQLDDNFNSLMQRAFKGELDLKAGV